MVQAIVIVAFSVNFIAIMVSMLRLGRHQSNYSPTGVYPDKEQMKDHVLWHSFYINPNDPRGWVPKAYGYGWTINFRTKNRAYFFGVQVLLQLALALLLTWAHW
jgi:uncharacterized membrane protein